eukprot:CAMPEP_0202691088 /NCGR_PEP_ID=MMETSP1385-20130828/5900_1 /ASSEMBLY_ACC=CAM_ASM_000861 /TAXON_ID=933848 /ORGANISM="Elphidium margaritaceum" /LENGTH=1286 /DNA_ID=CAMNT_0049346437 /DNA_START=228 /DNA_END=4088 /DNA_ORIENTATION=-
MTNKQSPQAVPIPAELEELDMLLDEIEQQEKETTDAQEQEPAVPQVLRQPTTAAADVDWDMILKAIQEHKSTLIKNMITAKNIGINAQNPENGKTLLIYAVIVGDIDLVRTICNFGADVKVQDNEKMDALQYAMKYGRYKITEMIYYRTLSGSLGLDMMRISRTVHGRLKECESMCSNEDFDPLYSIHEYMTYAIKERLPFDESMLFYAWYHVTHDEKTSKKPFKDELWTTMMSTYEAILSNTDDKAGWAWLQAQFLSSYIWYLPHPDAAKREKKDSGDLELDILLRSLGGDELDADEDKNNDNEQENEDDVEGTLKKTLFWELLHRVRTESKKQSDKTLKHEIDTLEKEKAQQWNDLVMFNVKTKYSSNARQDSCGCLMPKFSQEELSETRYPPSTHFSALKHYDANIYLNELLFVANILDKEFQDAIKTITKEINREIGAKAAFRAGPVKTLKRSQVKVENDYIAEAYPTSARILDLNRCALQFVDVESMLQFVQVLMRKIDNNNARCIKSVIRCKNGWSVYNEAYPQYTDIKLNVLVQSETDPSQQIVAELQFLLKLMSSFKRKSHKLYSVERKFEMVYNYGALQKKMGEFKDSVNTNEVYKELIRNGDFDYFILLWKTSSSNLDSLVSPAPKPKIKDHAIVCAMTFIEDKFHDFLLERFGKQYIAKVSSLINQRNVLAAWDTALEEIGSAGQKKRFVKRFISAVNPSGAYKEYGAESFDANLLILRSLNMIKGFFDPQIDRYLAGNQIRVAKPEADVHFDFHAQTQLKFVDLESELYVFGSEGYDECLLGFGQDNETNVWTPQLQNVYGENIISIGCASGRSLALAKSGKLYSWGEVRGRLGLGLDKKEKRKWILPTLIPSFSTHKVLKLTIADSYSLVLTEDGSVWSWGDGRGGCLGHGDEKGYTTPTRIKALERVKEINACYDTGAAILNNGTLLMWGSHEYGQCGLGTKQGKTILKPTKVSLDDGVVPKLVAGGDLYTLMLTTAGKLYSFGYADNGVLGHGNEIQLYTPKLIDALSSKTVVVMNCGDSHNLAVTDDGSVHSWGRNRVGQLGHNDTKNYSTPKQIQLFGAQKKAVACYAGASSSAVVTADNELYMFGEASAGQLGVGPIKKKSDAEKQKVPKKVEAFEGSGKIECVSIAYENCAVVVSRNKMKMDVQIAKLAGEKPPLLNGVDLSKHDLSKYEKMKKIGMPEDSVRNKMRMDRIDEKVIAAFFGEKLKDDDVDDDSKEDEQQANVHVLAAGESKEYIKPPNSMSLAVYIKNQSLFLKDEWLYVTHFQHPK